ncbi:MAG: coenzyme F420-0:L-glutamate ligase [Novosphingobium sp.]|nr:coenzyme F420-0:L-glutamate ligase [Novosphingobium sp.]MCP5379204.1 coenzyme F420-0:L-glutamate ligase [Novosphingobium sp.]MCP5389000.1 coenzyme F420-0:L-glutamate ligase [Novosphingobium sp.]
MAETTSSASSAVLSIRAVPGIPEVRAGDDLAGTIAGALDQARMALEPGAVLVVAQKIVSKAEGRLVLLADVNPGQLALDLAGQCGKDPRIVELVLRESSEVLRCAPGVLIARHRCGFVVANAGIDQSNLPDGDGCALLLPQDSDASARALCEALSAHAGGRVGVIVSDSFGRPWRVGTSAVAIGCAGLAPLHDQRGMADRHGRVMQVTQPAVADQLAGAAALVMGEGSEGLPVAVVSGWPLGESGAAASLLRPAQQDLFR